MKTRSFKVHFLVTVAIMAFSVALLVSVKLFTLPAEWLLLIVSAIFFFCGTRFQRQHIQLKKGLRHPAKIDDGEHIAIEEVN